MPSLSFDCSSGGKQGDLFDDKLQVSSWYAANTIDTILSEIIVDNECQHGRYIRH